MFQKISDGEQSLWKRRGGGLSIFSVENFCLKVPKNFISIEKIYASKNFVVPKHFVEEPFCAVFLEKIRRKNLKVAKKCMDKKRGGVSHFSVEIFFSQFRQFSYRNT